MDSILNFVSGLDYESTRHLLSDAAQTSVADWAMKIGLVWMLMGRKVNARFGEFQTSLQAHFTEVESGFANMVGEMKELKENVTSDLGKHSQLLGSLSTEVQEVKTRVGKLENKEK